MEHLERLAVVGADADLEPHLAGEGIVDHPAHLEAVDLAGEDAVLLDRRRTTGDDQVDELAVRLGGHARLGQRLGHAVDEGATFEVRHLDGQGERRRATGQGAGARLGHDMHAGRVVADRPGERGPELAIGSAVGQVGEEHPRGAVLGEHRGTGAERAADVGGDATVIGDERSDPHRVQLGTAGRVDRGRHGATLPARVTGIRAASGLAMERRCGMVSP